MSSLPVVGHVIQDLEGLGFRCIWEDLVVEGVVHHVAAQVAVIDIILTVEDVLRMWL